MINLYVARHGQTDWNKEKRFQARSDIELNKTGLQQAADLKSLLENSAISFDNVFSSPLSRAYKTATILANGSVSEVITDERLLELNMGDFEGKKESDLETELGAPFIAWRDDIFIATAPNGEAFIDVCRRCEGFLQSKILTKYNGSNCPINILIVAHQGVNIALQAVLSGNDKTPFTRALHKYKQHNDEINVWGINAAKPTSGCASLLKKIKL